MFTFNLLLNISYKWTIVEYNLKHIDRVRVTQKNRSYAILTEGH